MGKWIQKLSVAQKIVLRAFFMVLGLFLSFIVFYAGAMEMLHLTEKEAEWTTLHSIFSLASILSITLSIALERITNLFDLAVSFLSKFTGKTKKE